MSPVTGNPLKVECVYCEVELNASLAEMKRHAKTSKHARNEAQYLPFKTQGSNWTPNADG